MYVLKTFKLLHCVMYMLNEQKSLAFKGGLLIFFIIIDTVPTGQVYIVVIPGGLEPDWGSNEKIF